MLQMMGVTAADNTQWKLHKATEKCARQKKVWASNTVCRERKANEQQTNPEGQRKEEESHLLSHII